MEITVRGLSAMCLFSKCQKNKAPLFFSSTSMCLCPLGDVEEDERRINVPGVHFYMRVCRLAREIVNKEVRG